MATWKTGDLLDFSINVYLLNIQDRREETFPIESHFRTLESDFSHYVFFVVLGCCIICREHNEYISPAFTVVAPMEETLHGVCMESIESHSRTMDSGLTHYVIFAVLG